jgi:2-polyprenyl-3-methyl-5-hydroxy-6-metoxy-1,4-benzoquinol methylase
MAFNLPENAVPVERISVKVHPSMPCLVGHILRYAFAVRTILGKTPTWNNSNLSILDCACGTGYGTEILANITREDFFTWAYGVDISPEAIDEALTYHGKKVIEVPYNEIGYSADACEKFLGRQGNHSWDWVVSFETIEHVDDWKKLLEEFRRVVKVGMVLSVPNREPDGSWQWHKTFEFTEAMIACEFPFDFQVECYGQRHQPDSSIHPLSMFKDPTEPAELLFVVTRK